MKAIMKQVIRNINERTMNLGEDEDLYVSPFEWSILVCFLLTMPKKNHEYRACQCIYFSGHRVFVRWDKNEKKA